MSDTCGGLREGSGGWYGGNEGVTAGGGEGGS
jgi:hypothetical protein